MTKVFIDGSSGTTGLQINERLAARDDIELVEIPYERRHDPEVRREAIAASDITFLCLPDDAARESAELAAGSGACVIDASTAHRVDPQWTYGFPELIGAELIAGSRRIANPGCHASGFLSLVYPLVKAGIIGRDAQLSCYSLTGYSGGGKKMIAEYEDERRGDGGGTDLLLSPRSYGLTQSHKHLPEMAAVAGLTKYPLFSPIVADYYSGMETVVQLAFEKKTGVLEEIKRIYREFYTGPIVRFGDDDENGMLAGNLLAGRDDMVVSVFGNDERLTLVSRFDNLGKGASGAAIQNMNLVMGVPAETGLRIGG